MDPLYIQHLQRYLNYSVENVLKYGNREEEDNDNTTSTSSRNYDEIVVDGKAVQIPKEPAHTTTTTANIQRDPDIPPSPHITFRSGRNAWQVKDRRYHFDFDSI